MVVPDRWAMAKQQEISQQTRVLILALNCLVFYGLYQWSSGDWEISGGGKSLWLVSGISLWLLNLISAPWFQPPRDNLGTSIVAVILLLATDLAAAPESLPWIATLKWFGVSLAILAVLVSVTAILGRSKIPGTSFSVGAYRLSGVIGRGEVLFTPPALIGIYGFYPGQPNIQAALAAAWLIFVLMRPFELISAMLKFLQDARSDAAKDGRVGTVVRIDDPDIIRVALFDDKDWQNDRAYLAVLPNSRVHYLLPLADQIQEDRVLGTGIICGTAERPKGLSRGDVCLVEDEKVAASLVRTLSGVEAKSELVGFVVEGSKIAAIRFELSEKVEIEEGSVVFANVGGEIVFYQILEAETAEEKFQENPHGTQIATAMQIGMMKQPGRFVKFPWIPHMNQPIFKSMSPMTADIEQVEQEIRVGTLPGTEIPVLVNVKDLIKHHTAILGVTGTAKTELSLDLIKQAILLGNKVFCVDFTGEYCKQLEGTKLVTMEFSLEDTNFIDSKSKDAQAAGYQAGRNMPAVFRQEIEDKLEQLIRPKVDAFMRDGETNLAILELREIANTEATLRITEYYLSALMDWAKENRNYRRLLVVLEEAHTIVPEIYSSTGEKAVQWVVHRIGQIALQGRKYGVGLLVITQRTALVSKTILSQCNTFFVHSLIDRTSLEFLSSIMGKEHIRAIPNLRFLHFIAYGKAISSERPLMGCREFDQNKEDAGKALDVTEPQDQVVAQDAPAAAERPPFTQL